MFFPWIFTALDVISGCKWSEQIFLSAQLPVAPVFLWGWQKTHRCWDRTSGWVVNSHRQCFIYLLLIFLQANSGSLVDIFLQAEVWKFQQWPGGTITAAPRLAKEWPTCTRCLTFLSLVAISRDSLVSAGALPMAFCSPPRAAKVLAEHSHFGLQL